MKLKEPTRPDLMNLNQMIRGSCRDICKHIIAVSNRVKLQLYLRHDFYDVKAIPLQAWTSPEVSRRLKLPDFKTIGM
jgi:hypothetical protein